MAATTVGVLAVLFLSTVLRGMIGFGNAVVAMPLLALLVGVRSATPLVALAALTIGSLILFDSWRSVHVRSAWQLLASSFVGIPIGLFLLKRVNEGAMQCGLGVLLLGFAVHKLSKPQLLRLHVRCPIYIFGFVAGVLGGAYNTNGPPIVVYAALRGWPPAKFRATLQGYFLASGLAIVIGHGLTGLWTPVVMRLFVWSLPLLWLGVKVGGWLHARTSEARFKRLVYLFLAVMGVLLMARPLLPH